MTAEAHAPHPQPPRRRFAFGWLALWVAFVAYAAVLAPPDDPALTKALVTGTFTGRFGDVDASIAAVFSALGVVPALASALVLPAGASRRLPAWPFAVAMFAVGAFSLLLWLAFRDALGPREPSRPPGRVRRLLAKRGLRMGLFVALVLLTAWGLAAGHAHAYAAAFRTTSLVHVMTIDLAVCAGLLFVLVEEARRFLPPASEPPLARAVRFVPLFGSGAWAALVRAEP